MDEIGQRLVRAFATYLGVGPQSLADRRALWFAKEQTAVVVGELDTGHPRWFAVGHSGDGGGDGGRYAARAAMGATVH